MIEKLDNVINHYVLPLIQRHQWQTVDSQSSGRGAWRDFSAGNIFIRVSIDMQLLDIEIGSVHNKNVLRSVSFFKDLLEPPLNGRWNLSIEQQCDFIEKHWRWLNENLSKDTVSRTIRSLDNNANSGR